MCRSALNFFSGRSAMVNHLFFETIEYFRLNIEYLRYSFDFKRDGAKRHQ
ncbi:hypothetical protein D1BOALGB6SA_4657 [Olavius sp. associated proteobacterium Delta 1]|nr:hypothetical protein D1BOALGB6SA_4657 [Olavius sp. associated proteobacterium Delta 1]